MRVFASLFLVLFLADGGLSFVDELVSLLAPLPAISFLRQILGFVVIVMGDAVFFTLGMDKRLPKRVFIPLILFALLCPMFTWLFPPLADVRAFGLFAALAQLSLFLLVTSHLWKGWKSQGNLMLPKEMFSGPAFSWKNSLTFGAVNFLVMPGILVLVLLFGANGYLEKYTSGFMRVAPDGLHMTEKIYRRGDKTVRLAGMIHVGEKDYYDKVVGAVMPGRTIVLAEGVSDEKHLLRNRLDYGKVAGYLGLTTQQEKMHFRGRLIDAKELEQPQSSALADSGRAGQPDILRADVDISTFRPTTVWFLDQLGKHMNESPSMRKKLLASIAWSEKNVTPEMQKVVLDDILSRRNKELIRYFDMAVVRYDTVVIPWGALHMAAIEAEVVKQGFQLQQVNDRVSIRFGKKQTAPDKS